ncbi:Transposable element Hobo transposase [Frankliniella fusca]|uniref:Transposable element Hobo transposase n=1 Tax=Frankliniella fusca TaxID=407009 RepID=A0AAE1HRZ9_9NEOP|nr:Transposable element Hobo transposase [Frankliniella fusca]
MGKRKSGRGQLAKKPSEQQKTSKIQSSVDDSDCYDESGDEGDQTGASYREKKNAYAQCQMFAQGLKSGTYELVDMKILKPNGRLNAMWNTLRVLRHKGTGALQDAVQCGRCKKVLTYKQRSNGTSGLMRHLDSSACRKKAGKLSAAAGPEMWAEKVAPSGVVKQGFIKSFAEYCARDLRPPECAGNKGLVQLIQQAIDLGYRHGRLDAEKLMPCPATVRTYIETEGKKARDKFAEEVRPLIEQNRVSATTDCWTEEHRKEKYLVITLHYISDWNLQSRVFNTITLAHGDSCSAENLESLLQSCFEECSIDTSLMSKIKWVSDSGSDIKKALSNFTWLYCAGHALNIVLRTALSCKYADAVEGALRCSEQASAIIESGNEWVREVRLQLKLKKVTLSQFKLKLSVEASQSHVAMLRCIERNRKKINEILGDAAPTCFDHHDSSSVEELVDFLWPFDLDGSREASPQITLAKFKKLEPHLQADESDSYMIVNLLEEAGSNVLGSVQYAEVEELCDFLQPFQLHTDCIQGDQKPTLLYVEPALHILLEHCSPKEGDSPGVGAVRARAHLLLRQKVQITMEHKIARFLWPSQKHLPSYSEEERREVYAHVRQRCLEIQSRNVVLSQEVALAEQPPTSLEAEDSIGEATAVPPKRRRKACTDNDLFASQLIRLDEASSSKDDVDKYIEMRPEDIGDDHDKLNWWKIQGSVRFPQLSLLAQEVHACPGSSASSERVCSSLGLLTTDRRNRLLPKTVQNTITLRDHLRHRDSVES